MRFDASKVLWPSQPPPRQPASTPHHRCHLCPSYPCHIQKWASGGRWYAQKCVTLGVTANGHIISISISISISKNFLLQRLEFYKEAQTSLARSNQSWSFEPPPQSAASARKVRLAMYSNTHPSHNLQNDRIIGVAGVGGLSSWQNEVFTSAWKQAVFCCNDAGAKFNQMDRSPLQRRKNGGGSGVGKNWQLGQVAGAF